ncbi:MAG: NAD(P)/FAD-dependent oxidoreductase [Lachnospiraceae bacterium]|nr:NAD(P)/FAD-dependent oxidoreductase [Lachnospiraceae bacterium]
MYDVIIIGAGVSGCAAARELSRYKARVCVLEKAEDVCCGTSKANSAIAHAGYDAPTGSLMAKLNVQGNQMMEQLSKELDFEFQRIGSLVICRDAEDLPNLQALYDRGAANGVTGLRIVEKEELRQMEPNISDDAVAALYAPTAGIVCPFGMNIAFAENAAVNGVEFRFDTEVQGIRKTESGWLLETNQGQFEAKCVVNAAGVYADVIHNMVSEQKIRITPRRGDYCLLDKSAGSHVARVIFALPGKYGKGILVTPTVHGNLLVGPTAVDTENKEGSNTTREGLDQVIEKAGENVKNLPMRSVITSFAGLRAHEENHEFIIGEVEGAAGFVDCAGIESPGLTASPAIGVMVAGIVREILQLEENPSFDGTRKGILKPQELPVEERRQLIRDNPAYGNIICRCEMVTEGEIIDAITRPLGAKSLDGVKRRTRAGMGRCQAGFCSPRVMEILARECGKDISDITKAGGESRIVVGVNKDSL